MKRIKSDAVLQMAQVWIIALLVFAMPHPIYGHIWDPILHRPAFLIVAPLVLGCIPLVLFMKR